MIDLKDIIFATKLSEAVYPAVEDEDDTSLRNRMALFFPNHAVVTPIHKGGVDLCHILTPKRQYLVFRGTQADRVKDLITDADIRTTPFVGSMAHMGFVNGFMGVFPHITRVLISNIPLTITGHSAGGSLSILAAIHLPTVDQVIAIAPAACLDFHLKKIFEMKMGDRAISLINAFDIVPRALIRFELPQPIAFLPNGIARIAEYSINERLKSAVMGLSETLRNYSFGNISKQILRYHGCGVYLSRLEAIK